MKAAIVDLRYNMKDVLKALDRNEKVTILHRGKVRGTITPAGDSQTAGVSSHPFFGMNRDEKESVDEIMKTLRGKRYHAL